MQEIKRTLTQTEEFEIKHVNDVLFFTIPS